jgi:MFS family permease
VSRFVRPARSWRALALLVASAFFMENLDGTIVVTATQRMARSFRVPAADLNVTIAAYLLALGIFIPVSGWVADPSGLAGPSPPPLPCSPCLQRCARPPPVSTS